MKENECLRCHHLWYQRKPEKPRICPKCKSPYWDKERQRDLQAKAEQMSEGEDQDILHGNK